MKTWLSVFMLNIVGGLVVFFILSVALTLFGVSVDTTFTMWLFLFIQMCFVSTLLFQVLYKIDHLHKKNNDDGDIIDPSLTNEEIEQELSPGR